MKLKSKIKYAEYQNGKHVYLWCSITQEQLRSIRYILGDDLHVTYFNTGPVLLDFTRNTYKGRTALVALTLINEGEIQ